MPTSELAELLVADAAAWREWLSAHHDSSPGVWLVVHKKGGTVTELAYAAAVEEALCVGWIDGQARKRDEGSYRQRMTPRRPRSMWSVSNVARVERLESEGKMQPAGRAAVDAAKADGRWDRASAGVGEGGGARRPGRAVAVREPSGRPDPAAGSAGL